MGESSGPSRASPSLIIPAVIISLDSRQLGGKTPPLSAARQLCAGGRGQGCARGLPAHARDLRGKARGVRLHAGTTGPASPKSGCGRGPADAGGFGLRMKSRPSKRCFPAKHKLCQCKFFLLFPQKAILTLSIRDRACLQSKGAVSCLRYNARFYFFFLFSPCMFAFCRPR